MPTLIIANSTPVPQLALILALAYGALVTSTSLTEVLRLRELFNGLGFVLFSFIIGATYFGGVVSAASLFFGFPANRYIALALTALHALHLIVSILKKGDRVLGVAIEVKMNYFLLVILWLAIFPIFFSLYYPNDIYLPGEDMLRHYMWSVNLIRNPLKHLRINSDIYYLVFHSFEGG